MKARNQERRLMRLEELAPPPIQHGPDWVGWCDTEGEPCHPPEDVRRQVEEEASEPWRAAVWNPEQGLVMLLRYGRYELQIVELDERWAEQRKEWGVP